MSNPISERVRMLKTKDKFKEMDADSSDNFKENIFQKYSTICKGLENVCLADYASSYKA